MCTSCSGTIGGQDHMEEVKISQTQTVIEYCKLFVA